jgi:uncharacterized protein
MGHCDSSTQLSRHSGVLRAASGAVETDACRREDAGLASRYSRNFAKTWRTKSEWRELQGLKPPFIASFSAGLKPRPSVDSAAKAKTFGAWWLLAFVQFYKIFFSPFLGGACKFYPSCSNYAQEAIELHGARRGAWLALKRLGRCRPFTKGGFDPVPDAENSDAAWLRSGARIDGSVGSKERAQ